MKRIISLLLFLSLVFSMIPAVFASDSAGLSNFKKTLTYEAGHFTDVPTTQWYADSVKAAYEYGLVNGTSDTTYAPNGQVTVAAALALACRLHDIYYGGTGAFTEGSPWYQVYVDYATQNGIITSGQFSNCNAVITRAQFATVMAKALPSEALPAINNIDVGSLPDVPATAAYASAVYTLYNAGILVGNDIYGTFTPNNSIKRSEVATIMIRMADKSQRESFVPASTSTIPVTSVELVGSAWTLTVGTPFTFSANVLPANATDKSVTWTSSDTSVATVSADGTVTPLKEGTVVITVTSSNGKTGSRKLTVKAATTTTTTATTVFRYLADLTMTKGTPSTDKSLYTYTYFYETSATTYIFILRYTIESNTIAFEQLIADDGIRYLTSVKIDPSLSSPYTTSFVGMVSGKYLYAAASLFPATYNRETELTLSYYEDPSSSSTKENISSLVSKSAYLALVTANRKLLIPAGYSLKDLGFDNF